MKQGNIVYFSHGGGPLPLLNDPGHEKMISFMKKLPDQLEKPDAILVISAHWEEGTPSLIAGRSPELFYDYYGFPPETYELKYPVPGNPELAGNIINMLGDAGIECKPVMDRGFDHGMFIPLKMMYPQADIPTVQLSLIRGLDPEKHIALGKALRPLLEENILIIGSGFSFHNMGAFAWDSSEKADSKNDAFQDWLADVCTGDHDQSEREEKLLQWEKAPSARYCHPREEHLLPLHVCAGLAGGKGEVIFDDYILGKRALAIRW